MKLGQQVRESRKKVGMTQLQLAHAAGVVLSTIQNIERGLDPTLETTLKVTRALKASFSFDVGGSTVRVAYRAEK